MRTGIILPPEVPRRMGQIANLIHGTHLSARKGAATMRSREKELQDLVAGGADILEIATRLKMRHWNALLLHVMGFTATEIAKATGFKTGMYVVTLLKRPELQYLKKELLKAQRDHFVRGEFGAQAVYVASAPQIAANVAAMAGAGPDGKAGRAEKDADVLRASEMILKRADTALTANKAAENQLMALLKDFTPEELETLKREKKYPERYIPVLKQLGFLKDASAAEG